MMELHPLTVAVRTAYAEAANPDDAPAMQAYMKSEMPFYGVKSPVQKQINSKLLKEFPITTLDEYSRIIRELWNASYREERYTAIAFARSHKKWCILEALPVYRMMIETGAWWDYVDTIAIHLIGDLLWKYPSDMKAELHRWIRDEHLWIRRSAVLAQNRYKDETDEGMLFDFCRLCMEEKTFWMRKAIGWALRDYSKTKPASVRQFVEENRERMSKVTLREAVKYI